MSAADSGEGALADVTVLDLSRTVAGAITSMLLADQGAQVTKLEPPGGDPVRAESGAQVWMRNKRSAVIDLPTDRDLVLALAQSADVVLHSWLPQESAARGLTDDDLEAVNPRLIRCAVTGYGAATRHAGRSDDPDLVSARTGLLWEQRGWPGGPIARFSGSEPNLPGIEPPEGCWDGTDRPGPIMPSTPIAAIAAAHLGSIAITAALHARERTGRGQLISTTLVQGVLAATWGAWQRAERPDAFAYDSWVFDSRATRGMFECADGRWICHWMPQPSFVLGVSDGAELSDGDDVPSVHDDPARIMPAPEDLVVLHHYHPLLTKAFSRFKADEWAGVAARKGVTLQPIRTPAEALVDPAFLADGSIIDVPDERLGAVRQVGLAVRLGGSPAPPPVGPVAVGANTDEIRSRASRAVTVANADSPELDPTWHGAPLDGITVLDLGLAIAGPWGTQLLSDLGARVIKVNRSTDWYWHASHMAMACNRGKESITIDAKHPAGLEVIHRLVAEADVVQHNMRDEAAQRLGIGYHQLHTINPRLIYCHTTGFDDSRSGLPGNDQTGAALAGVLYEDDGCGDGGRPTWSLTSLGDIGNGFLSAFGILAALHHRDRTGEGQFVSTSIVRAHLLNASYAWLDGDGNISRYPRLDRDQLGFSALRRLYETLDGWLCLAVRTDEQWRALCRVLDCADLQLDPELENAQGRSEHDARLWARFETRFRERRAVDLYAALDAAGVPCEPCDPDAALGVFDDPELIERDWVTGYEQELVGRLEQLGVLFDFTDTPARVAGPPLVVGADTTSILRKLGYDDATIDELLATKAVAGPQ